MSAYLLVNKNCFMDLMIFCYRNNFLKLLYYKLVCLDVIIKQDYKNKIWNGYIYNQNRNLYNYEYTSESYLKIDLN